MRETPWTAPDLLQLSGAYWGSAALHTAVTLDVFSALENGPLSVAELAAARRLDPRALGMLVTALAAMKLLVREGDKVRAVPEALRFLSAGSAEFIGFIIRHHHALMPAWAELDKAVRTGGPARALSSADTEDEGERENFLMGMYNVAVQQARAVAEAVDLSGSKRLLDLGGGPGTYAIYFCRANPQLSAVVMDKAATRPFAEKTIRRFGLDARIRFEAGDFEAGEVPQGFDAVWISQILHGCEGPEEAARVVAKAVAALNKGGTVLIQEFALDDDRSGPLHPALFGLNMLVGTTRGQAYTEAEIKDLLRSAGAADPRTLDIALPAGCRIISAAAG